MKLSVAKRMVVNSAIEYAKRVTEDVTRFGKLADEYVASVRKNARADKIYVLEAACTHIEISRSAGTTYRQLRKLYPPLPAAQREISRIISGGGPGSPPTSNTGETLVERERPGGFLADVLIDGKPVNVFDVLGDYV